MRKENAFVLLLIGLCLALAAMAAFSNSPGTAEAQAFKNFGGPQAETHQMVNSTRAL